MSEEKVERTGQGLLLGLGAYLLWGTLPIYWKALAHVAPIEVLSHRILWSFAFVGLAMLAARRWSEIGEALRNPRTRRALFASTTLVTCNWFLYIWAVGAGRVTEASLGYYINPLFNVLLARFVLKERLGPLAKLAIGLATLGVLNLAISLGSLPAVSLGLAITFGLYGLVRKQAPVGPMAGLTIEVMLVSPLMLAIAVWLGVRGQAAFAVTGARDVALLICAGPVTALPLLLFAAAAKKLRFTTLGLVQYLSPTLQLLLAVLVFGEPFSRAHVITFALIWAAIGLYAYEGLRAAARARATRAAAGAALE